MQPRSLSGLRRLILTMLGVQGLSTLLASICLSVLGTYILPNISSLKTMAESLDIGSANWPTWAILVAGIFTALHIALSVLSICCDNGFVHWPILVSQFQSSARGTRG